MILLKIDSALYSTSNSIKIYQNLCQEKKLQAKNCKKNEFYL